MFIIDPEMPLTVSKWFKDFISLLKNGSFDEAKQRIQCTCGFHINMREPSTGSNVAHYVAKYHALDLLKVVGAMGADLDLRNDLGQTPLMRVVRNPRIRVRKETDRVDILAFLVETNTVSLHPTDRQGRTPFLMAFQSGNLVAVNYLLDYLTKKCKVDSDEGAITECDSCNGAFIDCPGEQGTTAILLSDPSKLKQSFMTHGADVNQADIINGGTPLHSAAFYNWLDVMKLLIRLGANVNSLSTSEDEYTPLRAAMLNEQGLLDGMKLLIDNGADANQSLGYLRYSLLHKAICDENMDTMKLLLDNGAKVSSVDISGQTPLSTAAFHGNLDALKLLIAYGADVDHPDALGRTPLHLAADHRQFQSIKLLIANGANVSCADNAGNTPLHLAAFRDLGTKTVPFLLEKGASLLAKNKKGQTAIDLVATEIDDLDEAQKKNLHADYLRNLHECLQCKHILRICNLLGYLNENDWFAKDFTTVGKNESTNLKFIKQTA